MAHDVFISHSAKDKITADAVCAMLESEGIRCWIAPRDVLPSMEWGEAIIDAIEECRIMVLVFTANANDSPQIRREVERAVNHGVAILPVRIEDVLPGKGLEYFIGNVHWLDALTPPLEAHLRSLAGTLKMLLERIELRNPSPTPRVAADVPRPAMSPEPAAARPAEPVFAPALEPAAAHVAPARPADLSQTEAAAKGTEVSKLAEIGIVADLDMPNESGSPTFGELHFGGMAAVAPRPSKTPIWAWGGGVLAVLLVAVFAAVHFTSHSAQAGPPPTSPEPAQSSPSTGGPGGAAPAAPAPLHSPAPIPSQGASKAAKPGEVAAGGPTAPTPTAPAAAQRNSGADGPSGVTPEAISRTEAAPKKINIGAGVAAGLLIQATPPIYPPIAKAAHISGTVVLRGTISRDGTIENLEVVSGPPMLQQASLDAVRAWRYRPYLLNNEPVEVETTINVTFTLGE